MTSDNISLIAILITIIVIAYILRDSISVLLKKTKLINYSSGKHKLKIETEQTLKTENATIVRSASESIVTADEPVKSGLEIKPFSTDKSYEFYQECAHEYDGANSEYLWETHRLIAGEIVEHFPADEICAIDLGGGTGRYIAIECMNQLNARVSKWTNLDFSENMQKILVLPDFAG